MILNRKTLRQTVPLSTYYTFEPAQDKRPVWPAKTQISLYIHPVWQGFSFIPLWIAWRLLRTHAISKDSDQTARMRRLIWVFTGLTSLIEAFVVCWLIFSLRKKNNTYGIYPTIGISYLPTILFLKFEQAQYTTFWCIKKSSSMSGKQCRSRSDATFCGIWSVSTLFAQTCLS